MVPPANSDLSPEQWQRKVDEAKLKIEERKLEVEERKLRFEQWNRITAGLSIVTSVILGLATIAYSLRTQGKAIEAQNHLKLFEMTLNSPNKAELRGRLLFVEKMIPDFLTKEQIELLAGMQLVTEPPLMQPPGQGKQRP